MSKIGNLVKQLCPNGVEWKALGEVTSIETGTQLNRTSMTVDGDYPVLNGGVNPSGYHHQYNTQAYSIAISQGGASAGYVNFVKVRFWAGAHCFVVKPTTDRIVNKFLFYVLKQDQSKFMGAKLGAGIPGLNKKELVNYLVPIPPLPVQEEIVRILDTFTKLVSELEAELEARKTQYAYYRNRLLTPIEVNGKWLLNGKEVEWEEIDKVFYLRNGFTPSKARSDFWENGTIPWFRLEDIRENGRILSSSIQHVTPLAAKNRKLFQANSIILSTLATIGEHALITVDFIANQQFTCLSLRPEYCTKIDMFFFQYYMYIIDEWCHNNSNVSGFASVDMSKFRKLKIPIPPMEEQERIVAILDKFDALVNDISVGIPAEIAARRKQYEYYREKLAMMNRQ